MTDPTQTTPETENVPQAASSDVPMLYFCCGPDCPGLPYPTSVPGVHTASCYAEISFQALLWAEWVPADG